MCSKNIKLKVVPKPAPKTRAVLDLNSEGITDFSGADAGEKDINVVRVNYVCGHCNSIIAENIKDGALKDVVVKCNSCGSYNEVV
jgi:predicted  nucleic acid-binding Zn-ribbon protein